MSIFFISLLSMPEISRFYGILISMNWWEPRHHAPHIHAHYAGHQATVHIHTGQVLAGRLPSRALRLVQEWLQLHEEQLNDLWNRAQAREPLYKIEPLE